MTMPWAGPGTLTDPADTIPPSSRALPGRISPAPGARVMTAGVTAAVPVSATLAANEALAIRRQRGEPVLPLAFGESGLPVHPMLTAEVALGAAHGGYGPVAGNVRLREAAAGYWGRRALPTSPAAIVAGPGSKSLLFGLLLAIDTDVAVPQPSWVSYAAQTRLIGAAPHFVAAVPGEGGVCDPAELDRAVTASHRAGHRIGAVLVTLPDNPTGRLTSPGAVREMCAVAEKHDLIIISDEIYRDLVHDLAAPFLSPALVAPDRTVVTTALSKSLSVGGWRIGVARMPDGGIGSLLQSRLLGIASEIWSAAAGPIQHAAAVALREPPELVDRVQRSRSLHAAVCRAAWAVCTAAGLTVPPPQAAFYLYPDFAPWRQHLAHRFGVSTGSGLAALLLDRYGMGTVPGGAFGESRQSLRLRLATGLLYGDSDQQRERALAADDPASLPWIAASLARLGEILADLQP
jgi:aspartate aminotransferase